jgi:NAD-reducing hydrogenase small subunit
MRNPFGPLPILQRAFHENVTTHPQTPCRIVPALLEKVRPVHELVAVDLFLPGCPPPADTFFSVLTDLLSGTIPNVTSLTRFGA